MCVFDKNYDIRMMDFFFKEWIASHKVQVINSPQELIGLNRRTLNC